MLRYVHAHAHTWQTFTKACFHTHNPSDVYYFHCCQISSAQVQDAGRYTCEATNVAGKTEKNYNLNVWGEFNLFVDP